VASTASLPRRQVAQLFTAQMINTIGSGMPKAHKRTIGLILPDSDSLGGVRGSIDNLRSHL